MNNMDQDFIDRLRKLVDEQGNAALTDAKRCKVLLGDYAGSGYKKESSLLLQAVEAGAAKAIDGADELEPCKKTWIRDLEEDYGFSQETAQNIVNTLALVLRGDTSVTKSMLAERAAAQNASAGTAGTEKDDAALDEANSLYNSKQFDKAAQLFRKLADAGNARAQLSLGNCYFRGKGVTQDYKEAVKWYRKAAEQGHADAQVCLGCCYDDGEGVEQDKAKAAYWYEKAAEQGNKTVQCTLGSRYADGEGVTQDKSKAAYWYEKSAEQGDETAQYFLACCYIDGEGVEQDKTKAVYWYEKAAEQGDEIAQYMLGFCYAKGEGVAQDKTKAAYWFGKSAEQGDEMAKDALAKLNAKPANTKPGKGRVFSGLFRKKQGKDDNFDGLWEK